MLRFFILITNPSTKLMLHTWTTGPVSAAHLNCWEIARIGDVNPVTAFHCPQEVEPLWENEFLFLIQALHSQVLRSRHDALQRRQDQWRSNQNWQRKFCLHPNLCFFRTDSLNPAVWISKMVVEWQGRSRNQVSWIANTIICSSASTLSNQRLKENQKSKESNQKHLQSITKKKS